MQVKRHDNEERHLALHYVDYCRARTDHDPFISRLEEEGDQHYDEPKSGAQKGRYHLGGRGTAVSCVENSALSETQRSDRVLSGGACKGSVWR
jgi:hypothetical protein